MIIGLIGYRATGKSTVGHLLAERLGWTCVDTDIEVQLLAGCSVREIFAREGEEAFREYETRVLQQLTRRHKLVLALGGGAVLRPVNRQLLALAGPVVWLQAAPETIRQRLAADPTLEALRPSLTGVRAADEVERVLKERLPIYAECADVMIDTEGLRPSDVVDRILAALDLSSDARLS